MAKQIIIPKGISTESVSESGECVNLVNLRGKNGALVPVAPRMIKQDQQLNFVYEYMYIHSMPDYQHLIGVRDGKLIWITNEGGDETELSTIGTNASITQIGNILNVVSSTGLYYLLWEKGKYSLVLSDYNQLQSDDTLLPTKTEFRIEGTTQQPYVYMSKTGTVYSDYQSAYADRPNIKTKINELWDLATYYEKQKGYINGFFQVCTAIELYDGNVILHSNPILLGQNYDFETRYNTPRGDYWNNQIVAYKSSIRPLSDEVEKDGYEETFDSGSIRLFNNDVSPVPIDNNYPDVYPYRNIYPLGRSRELNGNASNNQSFATLPKYTFVQTGNLSGNPESNQYWTVIPEYTTSIIAPIADNYEYPATPYQYWGEEFYDLPEGTRRTVNEIIQYWGLYYQKQFVVERTAVPYNGIVFPNMVGYNDLCVSNSEDTFNAIYNPRPMVVCRRSEFQYRPATKLPEALKSIIRSVNVYVTTQVDIFKATMQTATPTTSFNSYYGSYSNGSTLAIVSENYMREYKSNAEILAEIESKEIFYKVKEIPFEEYNNNFGNWIKIDLSGGILNGNPEGMPVDTQSRVGVLPKIQYVYNSRLHILNYKEMFPKGWPLSYFYPNQGRGQLPCELSDGVNITLRISGGFAYASVASLITQPLSQGDKIYSAYTGITYTINGVYDYIPDPNFKHVDTTPAMYSSNGTDDVFYLKQTTQEYWIEVKLQIDGEVVVVRESMNKILDTPYLQNMLTYPDSRAYEMKIYYRHDDQMKETPSFELKPHPIHNFAYYIDPDINLILFNYNRNTALPKPDEYRSEQEYDNGLKVSEVNNPLLFPNENTFVIGNGEAKNMGSNALRVSEGQFGQYPLYVFTTMGIYALQIGTQAIYQTQAPISLEQVTRDKILETPFGLVYVTKKGLMMIAGQTTTHISKKLEQPMDDFNYTQLPSYCKDVNGMYLYIGVWSQNTYQAGVSVMYDTKYWKSLANTTEEPSVGDEWEEIIDAEIVEPFNFTGVELNDYLEHDDLTMVFNPHENEIIIGNKTDKNFVYNISTGSYYISTEKITAKVENAVPELFVLETKEDVQVMKDFKYTNETNGERDKASCSLMLLPINFGTEDYKKCSRVWVRGRIIKASELYYVVHGSEDGIYLKALKGAKMNNNTEKENNYKDVSVGLFGEKHRYYSTSIAFTADESTKIELVEMEVSKEYDNTKN